MQISKKAIDLIIAEEVSSPEYYTKKYQKPICPGLASGITIGVGYDLGYNTPEEIQKDWENILTNDEITILQKYAGLTQNKAVKRLEEAQSEINIPWDKAYQCFSERTLPKWIETVNKALPNAKDLSPDSLGALVSLTYNRGPSFSAGGDRYIEMRNIKKHMLEKNFDKIPNEFRAMKRLWANTSAKGLLARREREAVLFADGLKN